MKRSKNTPSALEKRSLDHFKKLLLAKRKEAEEQLELTTESILSLDSDNDPDYRPASNIPEAGSDTQSDSLNYQLAERTRKYIKEIDNALKRIKDGTYGICQATGKPISKARLEAVPHTRYSIHAKNENLDIS
ncbi:MAG TPA: TraR/DksA C4-type zinc finger protein [Gracilimonas sp.]|nr:TraR/DksA C4-type zinc finger protein [Gracilimonas sp.]